MKNRMFVTLVLLAVISSKTYSQVDFVQVKTAEEMGEVWKKAQEENLHVFVDIYAVWCGPCKWMDANVFASKEAGDYLGKGFISVKMDGETPFGSVFARENGLQ